MLGLGSLRCRLGWHRPGVGQWHHGYCFTTCGRCGRDMVRSAFGEWHVPSGFRVVAHGDAAAIAALDATLTARDAAAPVRPAPVAQPRPARRPSPAPPPVPRPAPAGSPFDFGDFDMVDPTAGSVSEPGPDRPPLSRAVP